MTPTEERELFEAIARIEVRTCAIEKRTADLVTRWEFAPVRMLVYGMAGLLLSAVMVALVRLAIVR